MREPGGWTLIICSIVQTMCNDRTHILFLTGSLNLGGTERNILHLATRLDRARFEVEVWSDYEGEPLQGMLREQGIACHALKGAPSLGKPFLTRLFRHNLPYQWRLFRLLRKNRRAVVHAFGFPMAYYAVLLGRLAGCRRILFAVQDWDVWKKSWRYRLLDRLCSRLAARGVADGEGARRLAIERQGMAARRLVTIYDGVNVAELVPSRPVAEIRRALGLDPDRPTVGMIARLDVKKKAQDVFLDAVPAVLPGAPEAQFLLVGNGPDRAIVERRVTALPPAARVILAGARTDLADMLAAVDILVIPSRWESVPKILLEAMWMAKPVVAARVGDIAEVLDEQSGVLVNPDRPEELAAALRRLLLDAGQRARLGRAAHERIVERRLTLDDSIRAYENLYASLP